MTNRIGILTTEFGLVVGVLAASYELAQGVLAAPTLSLGAGIGVAGVAIAIAYMAGKYAHVRTEAKKPEVTP